MLCFRFGNIQVLRSCHNYVFPCLLLTTIMVSRNLRQQKCQIRICWQDSGILFIINKTNIIWLLLPWLKNSKISKNMSWKPGLMRILSVWSVMVSITFDNSQLPHIFNRQHYKVASKKRNTLTLLNFLIYYQTYSWLSIWRSLFQFLKICTLNPTLHEM